MKMFLLAENPGGRIGDALSLLVATTVLALVMNDNELILLNGRIMMAERKLFDGCRFQSIVPRS